MKSICKGAALVGVFFIFATGCVSGPIDDKRAPGEPGKKTFQLLVDNRAPGKSGKTWVTVPEKVWDVCGIEEHYPDCEKERRR